MRRFYQITGTADVPLVLVHGSWDSAADWSLVVPRLAQSFRVVAYDRRGYSRSERPTGQGSVRDDVADLAALIELATALPRVEVSTLTGAGHVPHATHPDTYVDAILAFTRRHTP